MSPILAKVPRLPAYRPPDGMYPSACCSLKCCSSIRPRTARFAPASGNGIPCISLSQLSIRLICVFSSSIVCACSSRIIRRFTGLSSFPSPLPRSSSFRTLCCVKRHATMCARQTGGPLPDGSRPHQNRCRGLTHRRDMQDRWCRTCWPLGTGPTNVSCASRPSVTIRPLTFTRGQPCLSTAPCQMRHPAARRSRGANRRSYSAFSIGIPHRRRPTGPCFRGRRPGTRSGRVFDPLTSRRSNPITSLFKQLYGPRRVFLFMSRSRDFFSRAASRSSRICRSSSKAVVIFRSRGRSGGPRPSGSKVSLDARPSPTSFSAPAHSGRGRSASSSPAPRPCFGSVLQPRSRLSAPAFPSLAVAGP